MSINRGEGNRNLQLGRIPRRDQLRHLRWLGTRILFGILWINGIRS